MRIANPIYDSVFKHLMDDLEIAQGLIGRLLGVKVLALQVLPQEITQRQAVTLVSEERMVRLFRLDFAAEVEMADGGRHKVLIELQKAFAPEVIGRFRNYLGKHYARPAAPSAPNTVAQSLPIIAIYILGFELGPGIPKVVRVERRYLNAVTRHALPSGVKDDFLEQLTHDAVAVQIPLVDDHAETELERALLVFNQHRRDDNPHYLVLEDGTVALTGDALLQMMMRKLQFVASDAETQEQMELEDELGGIFHSLEEARRQIEEERGKTDEARRQTGEARLQIEEERRQAEEARRQADEARRQADEERRQKEQALSRLAEIEEKLRHLEGGA